MRRARRPRPAGRGGARSRMRAPLGARHSWPPSSDLRVAQARRGATPKWGRTDVQGCGTSLAERLRELDPVRMLSAVAEFRRALALWALAIVLALVCAALSPFPGDALAAGKSHKSAAKHKKHTKHHKKKKKKRKKKRKKGDRKPAPAPARPSGGAAPPAPGTTPAPPSSKPG